MDEKDNKIPKFRSLSCSPNRYSLQEVVEMESHIIKHFNWSFLIPTPATFIDFFCSKSLQPDDKEKLNKDVANAAKHGVIFKSAKSLFKATVLSFLNKTTGKTNGKTYFHINLTLK